MFFFLLFLGKKRKGKQTCLFLQWYLNNVLEMKKMLSQGVAAARVEEEIKQEESK